jgi:TRAP-type C4-dicarboxylate transport system permease small subunit
MDRLLAGVCKLLTMLSAFLLLLILLLVFGNVVLRYVFNSGIVVSEELSRWFFVWLTFLGAIVALRDGDHLGTDFLVILFPRTGRKVLLGLAQLVMLYVTWLLLQGSWEQAKLNVETIAPVSGLSMSLFYGAGVVFGGASLVILGDRMWRLVTGRITDQELLMVRESEEEAPAHLVSVTGPYAPKDNK